MFSNFGNTQYFSIQTIDTRTPYSYSIMITNDIILQPVWILPPLFRKHHLSMVY